MKLNIFSYKGFLALQVSTLGEMSTHSKCLPEIRSDFILSVRIINW